MIISGFIDSSAVLGRRASRAWQEAAARLRLAHSVRALRDSSVTAVRRAPPLVRRCRRARS